MATSLSGAIHDAVRKLVRAFLEIVADDDASPLRGRSRTTSPPRMAASASPAPPRPGRHTSNCSPVTDSRN